MLARAGTELHLRIRSYRRTTLMHSYAYAVPSPLHVRGTLQQHR